MSRLSSMSRFAEPQYSEEFYPCNCCYERYHYLSLDDHGLCRDCHQPTTYEPEAEEPTQIVESEDQGPFDAERVHQLPPAI